MLRDLPQDTMIDGRYRVIERAGSGGMADVYCAEDTQLGRKVALKLLHRRFAEDREFVERFRREASSAAGLQHPNVVAVYDRGEWDGTSYIAMEYVEGRTLKRVVIEEAPLDPIRAIDLATQILRAARFAHKRGIIHRDLKPHNVIVDAEGRAKVTDFGIARAGASDMTQTGSIMGTAQYLSPEQAEGRPVTPQSDLYSVGICLYELLTGRLPFDGESAVTIALKQVNEAPLPPSAYDSAITPELEDIVLHALEKDPAHRFADADAFILALDRCRAHLAAASAAPMGDTRAFVPVGPDDPLVATPAEEERRGRRRWLVALVVLLLIGLAVAAYALTRPEKRVVPDVTRKPVAAALAILHNAGFATSVERTVADAPKDRVIRQDPQPRQKADKGADVTLTVSDGPGQKAVPDVVGQGRNAARRALVRAGFKIDERRETSDTVTQNRVISTSPPAASSIDVGSKVTLVVSSGRSRVAVPGVVGSTRDDARTTLQDAGLKVSITERADASHDAGTVVAQSPPAGTSVAAGSPVAIVVAKEPSVAVPDVTGKTDSDAVNALADAGLVPNLVTRHVTAPAEDGTVLRQNPSAGRKVKKGARVTITVGRFSPSPNPEPGGGATTPTPTTTTPTAPAPTTTPTTP